MIDKGRRTSVRRPSSSPDIIGIGTKNDEGGTMRRLLPYLAAIMLLSACVPADGGQKIPEPMETDLPHLLEIQVWTVDENGEEFVASVDVHIAVQLRHPDGSVRDAEIWDENLEYVGTSPIDDVVDTLYTLKANFLYQLVYVRVEADYLGAEGQGVGCMIRVGGIELDVRTKYISDGQTLGRVFCVAAD